VKDTRGTLRGGWNSPDSSILASGRGGAAWLDLCSLAALGLGEKRGNRERARPSYRRGRATNWARV
jgi:hypothetical protein